ncbi:spondin domain-containing protein [Kovacikia minuta CCNUW1]|uniref:spondin domain-containing protein n=1 Tax=Kovacikia minuta TaxID=2931930 RepID=UPI001CCEACE8|nr:spondin domain-containing protein [Kovacikia minuta]UBF24312.1 spondin domain-containing protein [Kovacikia minuta CCNUW1]
MQFQKLAIGAILAISAQGFANASQATPYRADSHLNLVDYVISQQRQLQAAQVKATRFKVRIENISTKDEFTASNGTKWTLDFSPGVWLISSNNAPLFTPGQKDRGQGIEAIAEDGNPTNLAKALHSQKSVQSSGIFNTAVGATKAGGIRPGQAFEFTVTASPGQKLSLVTMFGQSNDWFYAPKSGIALFDANGKPVQGNVTAQMGLWNAGTEVDEEPGIGATQGPRQKAPNSGINENGVVQVVQDQAAYAQTTRLMRITITPER